MCMHNTFSMDYIMYVLLYWNQLALLAPSFCKLHGFDTFQTRARIAEHGVKEKTSQLFNCKLFHNFDSDLHGKGPAQLSVLQAGT